MQDADRPRRVKGNIAVILLLEPWSRLALPLRFHYLIFCDINLRRSSCGWMAMRMRTVTRSLVNTSRPSNAAMRAVTRCWPSMRIRLHAD